MGAGESSALHPSPVSPPIFFSSLPHAYLSIHMLQTLRGHEEDFRALQRRGMAQDLSWDKAAQQYEQIFEWALIDPPYVG